VYLDNGQHLMMGAYREMLRLMALVGIEEQQAFRRRRLRLPMRSLHHDEVCVHLPTLPAPLHVLAGLASARGLSFPERYRALALCAQLFISGFRLDRDITVAEWLQRARQSPLLIKAIWEPLCLAALNTPLKAASAQVFIHVLREVFNGARADSDMLLPRMDLSGVFPDPAVSHIQNHGGTLHLGERVLTLNLQDGHIRRVITRHRAFEADHVILAITPAECLRLTHPHPALSGLSQQLASLRHEPICTVYLQYPPDVQLDNEMIGLLDGTGQWLFDLAHCCRPGLMAVVISGPGPHMEWDNTTLIARIRDELRRHFPHWPETLSATVIREKRATFSCASGINASRPGMRTPVRGLWLAGDFTATGLPATLEGAVISGIRCAEAIATRD
jgi:squalene-associated FAD-dependent desaturase